MIRYIISKMMGAEGLLMLLPMMVGIIYGEHTSVYFLITAAILTAIYLLFGRKCPENMTIYAKEGLIIVATAWIFWSLAGHFHLYSVKVFQAMWMLFLKQYPDLRRQVLRS